MNNLLGSGSAQLDTFSGIVSFSDPTSLPEGASSRNQNVDFNIGSVFTRKGLENLFTYENSAVGPDPGGIVHDVSNGSTWSNPNNILANDGFYTSNDLVLTQFPITSVQVVNFSGVFGTVVTFAGAVPTSGSFSFSGLTAFTALNGQTLTPTGFSFALSANQQSFAFGSSVYADTADTGAATVAGVVTPTDFLDIEEFGYSVPSTATPQGFANTVLGYTTTAATLNAQMLKAGMPVGNVESLPLPSGAPLMVTLGGINDLFGASWAFSDLNSTTFGLRIWVTAVVPGTAFLSFTTLKAYFAPTQVNFNYITTFQDNFGTIRTLAIDASGQWWVENVSTNPGVLAPLFNGPPPNSFATSFTADSRQYIAISDLQQGSYPPQQYTGQWNDRVSQVGPGQAPTFTGITASADTFDIASITQPVAVVRTFAFGLWSTGPGSTSPGNVVTQYYEDSTVGGADTSLVNAFNSGEAIYVFVQMVNTVMASPIVAQVTSVGLGTPPGESRPFYYFTYNIAAVGFTLASGHGGYGVTYQQSLATLTAAVPVPGLVVGNQITITGSSVANYNSNWTITQALNSGQFTITQTVITSGVATYTYSLIAGTVPTAGQLVTVTNTLNANGALNVVNATIVAASGGSSGTFTLNVSSPDFGAVSEAGQASTAGTQFTFDPGATLNGSSSDPIYGNATGGSLTFGGPTGQFIGPGTRKGTLFFITRNGYWTAPAPPVQFDIPNNTVSIGASNILIGPPNVIARAIVFTEGGTNGVPGASFYTIPTPVQYVVEGVTFTASSLFINDNTTTTATFSFPDQTLLNATEVDIQGQNLFQLGELGDAAWCVQYAGRTAWGRVRNQIQNFINLSFDGGYLSNPGGNILPAGWQIDSASSGSATLLNSPVFGNSYYINNATGTTQAVLGMIYQSAYQDFNNVAILRNQVAYSIRVSARTPSSATVGALIVDLTPFTPGTGFGATLDSFTLPLASMSSTMTTYEGTLLVDSTLNIPPMLMLRYYASGLANGGDLEIDRINIFPTEQPTNLTGVTFSYGTDPASGDSDPESFDIVTGTADTQTMNSQPANGGFTLRGLLYVVKESSLGYLKDTPNQEPANWSPFEEVSNVAGACGINAYTIDKHKGEEWAGLACQNGLFLFNGGAPTPIHLEIPEIWAAINWDSAQGLTLCNDIANRRMYAAIPLPTPNPWMTTTVVNSAPTAPNVVLMLNYEGIGSVDELMSASSMHITMTGNLAVHDIRRKWSLWTIPAPYIGLVKRSELRSLMLFCNGIASSKIYQLSDAETGKDDNAAFRSSYCTYGFVDATRAAQDPMFGMHNKRYRYMDMLASGEGTAQMSFYQNVLTAPYPYIIPGGVELSDPASNDLEFPLDEFAQRMFAEIVMDDGWFNLSRLTLVGGADKWSAIRGK